MSTTSIVTTLVVRDLTLSNQLEIVNCICILVATQGDGTPFSPDSFQEEDMVELCIGLGQAHPEVVLWLLNTKMVLMFQSGSKIMAVMCLFTSTIVWHDEHIKLHIHPPTGTQVMEYVAVRVRCPSGIQVQAPGREVVLQSPTSEPALKEGSQPQLYMTMRDHNDTQLREVLEELQLEQQGGRGQHPYLGSPWGRGWVPVGGSNANLDGGEVGLQGGWGPSKPVQQPIGPPQA